MSRNGHFTMGAPVGERYNRAYDGATGSAEGSAQGSRVRQMGHMISNGRQDMGDLRVSDAQIHMSGRSDYYLNAEAGRVNQMGHMHVPYNRKWDGATGSAEGSAAGSRVRQLGDIRRDYYDSSMRGLREDDASIALRGLREDDAGLRLSGLREEDAQIALAGLREEDAGVQLAGLRNSMALRGLREEDASIRLAAIYNPMGWRHGFRKGFSAGHKGLRAFNKQFMNGAEEQGPILAEAGFHQRFPVTVRIEGIGAVRGEVVGRHISGLFDFLAPQMSWDEAATRLQTLAMKEAALQQRLSRLSPEAQAAILKQNNAIKDNELFDGQIGVYLQEGPTGWAAHTGRETRMKATELALPTIDTLVSQFESGKLTPAGAGAAAQANVAQRIDSATGVVSQYAVPVAIAAVGTTIIVGLAYAVAKSA